MDERTLSNYDSRFIAAHLPSNPTKEDKADPSAGKLMFGIASGTGSYALFVVKS